MHARVIYVCMLCVTCACICVLFVYVCVCAHVHVVLTHTWVKPEHLPEWDSQQQIKRRGGRLSPCELWEHSEVEDHIRTG